MQISEITKALTYLVTEFKSILVDKLSFARQQAFKIKIHRENLLKMAGAYLTTPEKEERAKKQTPGYRCQAVCHYFSG